MRKNIDIEGKTELAIFSDDEAFGLKYLQQALRNQG